MNSFFVLLILILETPSCELVSCPAYPGASTGCVDYTELSSNKRFLEIFCKSGPNISVTQIGEYDVYCNDNQVWEGDPLACYCDCKVSVDETRVTLNNLESNGFLKHGHKLEWTCKKGLQNMTEKVVCEDGVIGTNLCVYFDDVDCGDFGSVMNGDAQNIRDGIRNSYGSVVTITCDASHVVVGSPHVECQASGSWGAKPSCEQVSCPTYPGASTGCVDYTELSAGNRFLEIYCKSGPNISVTQLGEYGVYCNDNQVWEGDPLACYCDCKVVVDETQVTLNNLESNGFLKHGRTLSWTCKKGVRNMTENVVCYDGIIGTNLCDGSCLSNPSVDNAEDPTSDPPYPENTHIDLECRRGYHRLEGTNKRYMCYKNDWSGNLTCKQTFCPSHPNITNGTLVNPKAHYPVDYKLEFECDPTYTLAEDLKVTCLPNGTWSSFNQTKFICHPHVDNAVIVSPANSEKPPYHENAQLEGPASMTGTLQGTWIPADPPVCALDVGHIILVIVLVIIGLLIIVLLILIVQYSMIKKVIPKLLDNTEIISGVLLEKDAVQEEQMSTGLLLVKDAVHGATKPLKDKWNPLKDSFGKFVWEKMKCKLTELAEQMKNLWKVSWENLRSQVIDDLVKVKKYKTDAKDMFQAWKDFKGDVDQLLKSAKVATTISLYKPHWFSILIQTKPENYVNEQTKAKRLILEVEKTWSVVQKERGDEIYNMNNNLDKMEMELKLLEEKIKTKESELGSLNSQKRGLEQEVIELKKRQDLTQEQKISKIKALEAEIEIVKQKIEKKKKEIENLQENINRLTKYIATKTEELKILRCTFQNDASWQKFNLLNQSLKTIMQFWSKKPDSGEEEETLL